MLRYDGEMVKHAPASSLWDHWASACLCRPYSPQLKDLKRQLHLERKRADKLQERLQDILTNSKSRSGEGPGLRGQDKRGVGSMGRGGGEGRAWALGPELLPAPAMLGSPALSAPLELGLSVSLSPALCLAFFRVSPLF